MKILKGDKVLVIAGKDRGKTGVVERVSPRDHRLVVAGLNIVKKHTKATSKNPQGGIIELARSVDCSNVMLLDPSNQKPTRVSYVIKGKEKIRVCASSKQEVQAK